MSDTPAASAGVPPPSSSGSASTLEERRAAVLARLEAKHSAREADRARRQAACSDADPTQTPEAFWSTFTRKINRIRPELDKFRVKCRKDGVTDETRPALEAQLDGWHVASKELQADIADATLYLPAYDVRHALGQVVAVDADLAALRLDIMPRKRFTFSARARAKKGDASSATTTAGAGAGSGGGSGGDGGEDAAAKYAPAEYAIRDKTGEVVVVDGAALQEGQDLRLENLADCVIVLRDTVRAIRGDNLTRCHVYCGPVAGSVLLHTCTECVFFVASRQIRIHASHGCDYYLSVRSNPIIEDCSGLRFAPYNLHYPSLAGQLADAGLPAVGTSTQWQLVDDFHWHRVQHSPNWATLPASSRLATLKSDAVSLVDVPDTTVAAPPAEAPVAGGGSGAGHAGAPRSSGDTVAVAPAATDGVESSDEDEM